MRKIMIERIRKIIGFGKDSYVVNNIKLVIADALKQDVTSKAGKRFIQNLDITNFDFDKMILQDEDLLFIFETAKLQSLNSINNTRK